MAPSKVVCFEFQIGAVNLVAINRDRMVSKYPKIEEPKMANSSPQSCYDDLSDVLPVERIGVVRLWKIPSFLNPTEPIQLR
jgi:hypothetical protein